MRKKYIVIGVLLTLGIFGMILAAWLVTRPRGYVEVNAAPTNLTVAIDGKTQDITSGDTITLAPGGYLLEFSADGFESSTEDVSLDEEETTTLYVALTPKNDTAKQKMNSEEARKIAEQAAALEREKFLQLLPIESANFSIVEVPALLKPSTYHRDILVNVKNTNGEKEALDMIRSLGFPYDKDDLLFGKNNQHAVVRTSSYEVKAMFDKSSPDAALLYITPLNTPYVPRTAPYNDQLESIRSAALAKLEQLGFTTEKYDIYYNDHYLSKYSPTVHDHATHG